MIQMALIAINKTQNHQNFTSYQTVSIASDGKSKCGDALVLLTMKESLSSHLPIYSRLHKLELMNDLVGDDDIMVDKDFTKHVFKCQRNLMMRNKGIEIQGYCITPAILWSQLQSNGVSSDRLRSLLNPNDKQDVVLCYLLLKEIWDLPPPLAGATRD